MPVNRALLLSIRSPFAESIFSGTKRVELRRVKPRIKFGDLVIVYASGSTKGIIGAFEVAGLIVAAPSTIWRKYNGESGLTETEFYKYFDGVIVGYAIEIGRFWPLPEPITLDRLRQRHAGFRPPQSYHYWNFDELTILGVQAFSKRLGCRTRNRPH